MPFFSTNINNNSMVIIKFVQHGLCSSMIPLSAVLIILFDIAISSLSLLPPIGVASPSSIQSSLAPSCMLSVLGKVEGLGT